MSVQFQTHMQAQRSWETIQDVNKIKYILKEYIHFQGLLVKESPFHQELKPMEIREDGTFIFPIDSTLTNINDELVLYRTLSKHIEISFDVIEKTDTQIICKPLFARIAKAKRMSPRIEGLMGKVIAHKFLIPRKELDIAKVLGTSGQIILNDLNRKVKQIYPSSKLVFNSSKELSPEEELVKKYKKPIYIRDTSTLDSNPEGEFANLDLLPIKETLQEELILEERLRFF
ncbi:PF07614 family protein [Leptospira interrogans serovar Lora str. TE 1992]|nr:PF07614 family protein [Leptospira interrogans serovar Lora str. TE 1992]